MKRFITLNLRVYVGGNFFSLCESLRLFKAVPAPWK